MIKNNITIFFLLTIAWHSSYAQIDSTRQVVADATKKYSGKVDTTIEKYNKLIKDGAEDLTELPDRYIKNVNSKINKYSNRLTNKTEKTLTKLSRWENKIHKILQKVNPEAANKLFNSSQTTFTGLLKKIKEGQEFTSRYKAQYDQYRDNLTTSLKYLENQKDKLNTSLVKPLEETNKKMGNLTKEVDKTEAIQAFIKERKKQLLSESIKYIGKSKYLSKISKESYYYSETLKNYKEIFSDSKKAEATAKNILNKIPAFKKFTQQNSLLSQMFAGASDNLSVQNLAGLQTRTEVNALIQDRIATGGPNAREVFAQNIQQAQTELKALKDKLLKAGGNSDLAEMPNFKPNTQKTKTFAQRLEFGTNFQFAKNNTLVPTTADIALTAGYKLNDKSTIGLGASYKMGMGSIQHISITHQGIGLRSFVDWKLKKQFFVSGGFEMNYNAQFKNIANIKNNSNWQNAGLIGLSKKMNIKTKWFKGTKLQLLYDVMAREHKPISQPVLFRVGYSF